ncbi:hypothetical protein T552_00204 [Pneumocystis carinii B80]|uniref:Aspartate aminotransferase n=1 Tax=Pneumocystis carinii (strain B80) TaxID=1408658 RepID=A0A0W4ZT58_PNEC8|nr:hypothetical protein T552_00204 [Pneumocystis carinii B80]KTW31566.1 hypothetical protein T552_00204 [Pneumocystis carinii B80]
MIYLQRNNLRTFFPKFQGIALSSTWAHVQQGPRDPILGINEVFELDKSPLKVNLGVGSYRDDQGKPYVLPSVKEAERRILFADLNKEYAAITGVSSFVKYASRLAYGEDSKALKEGRISVVQSVSGTGALRLGGEFLNRFYSSKKIYLPSPTWGNHIPIFKDSGLEINYYRYFDKNTIGFDIEGALEDIRAAPKGSIILFHVCAHNPTGVDPTLEQWHLISDAIKSRNHYVFFDMAYQGFASGDLLKDSYALRYFVEEGHSLCVSQSFAKNMGLYGERVGTFSILCESSEEKERVESQLKILIRPLISNPPIHGARIAAEILGDNELYKQWLSELKGMANRIISSRKMIRKYLEEEFQSKHDWSHITSQIGMFCYTGLNPEQVRLLTEKYHIYLTKDGRISIAGISTNNARYVSESIHNVTK